ncbi:MAG: hypothetical protein FWF92_05560 [Oscillospiraceae bacterium]|nr:hypothetical protein [Oscillospiraceae bacterium]
MKKFFNKPYNLLFTASSVILLQFLSSVIYFYMQAIINQGFDYWSYFIYIIYCLAVCVITGIFIIKKLEENKNIKNINYVKMWFSGFFLYAFCEILLLIKMLVIEYSDSTESASNLWDNQHLYRLFLCVSVIFLIYCVMYILEKKRIYFIFAGVNLFLFCLFIIFMPDITEFLLVGNEGVLEVISVVFAREAGTVLFMLNLFIFALYELYNYKE